MKGEERSGGKKWRSYDGQRPEAERVEQATRAEGKGRVASPEHPEPPSNLLKPPWKISGVLLVASWVHLGTLLGLSCLLELLGHCLGCSGDGLVP